MLPSDAYLAGFFDGEGCIGIYTRGRKNHHLRVQLVQNESAIVTLLFQSLQDRFGGSYTGHKSTNGRSKYNWQLSGDKAVSFLEFVLPYLVLKKEQAELAIQWQKARPGVSRDARGRIVSRSDEQLRGDSLVAELIKLLKRRDSDALLGARVDLVAARQALLH